MITLNKEAPQSKFTLIKNAFHTDYDLSDGAFRLLFHLMSLPNDWEINWEQIAKTLKISLATLKRRKKELIDKNILQRQREVIQNKLTNHQQYFINNKAVGKKRNRKHNPMTGGDISWKKKLLPWQLIQIDIKYLIVSKYTEKT